ncbi:MAG: helix-turn-helix domain-containing protein [Alphaproteobacteria bacterium]
MKKLVKENVAAAVLGCSVHKLQKDRRTGNSIPYVKIGRAVRYHLDTLETYIQERTFTCTTQHEGK